MKLPIYKTRAGAFGLATLCCFLWGSSYPAIKNGYALLQVAQTDIASQMLFAGYRFVLAGLLLLFATVALGRRIIPTSGRQFRQVAVLGFTQTAFRYVFFYIGLAHASGVKSSIMNATGVFFSVILAHFLYADDRANRRKALGCCVGFLGVIVVNLGGDTRLNFEFSLLGEGFVIIAAFVLAAASIYGKRVSRDMDSMVMTGWQLFIGGGLLTLVGVAGDGALGEFALGSGALLLYLALLSSVAFGVWSLLLKHNPVTLITAFNFLVPVFGVALSGIFLGESLLRWSYLAALILVCAGIWLVTRATALSNSEAAGKARKKVIQE